jgi:hypothetical protein
LFAFHSIFPILFIEAFSIWVYGANQNILNSQNIFI